MYELIQAGAKSYYINCPSKIGVYVADDKNVYLIDSGNDKDAGKKVRKILDAQGWQLKGILNTHSHADHIGGNRYLQEQTGCRIYSGGIEAAFTEFPVLEPTFLYGGWPNKDLRHKFLMAAGSEVSDFTDEDFPKEVEVIPLPGHSFDMVGFRTPDDTVFLADCVSSKETLDKYAVSFIYDVGAYLDTLAAVETMKAAIFIPAHAPVGSDMSELVRVNRDKVYEIKDVLYDICKKECQFEEILQKVFSRYGLTMSLEQYVLVGSTVRSYLSWMKERGELEIIIKDNCLLWGRA